VCWIVAIWIYPIQFFITGLFFLFLAYILSDSPESKRKTHLPAAFFMDKSTRTLTVQEVYDASLRWEDNEICSGMAKLPKGVIKAGDKITDCSGNVALRHVPSNTLFGAYNFE
jgi:hypothetical protein